MSKKILVVDDDFSQRELYSDVFNSAGFDVTVADDGQDAWEKIQHDKPDLVFSGILMPRMTGFELIDKIRSNLSTVTIPIIIFSHLGKPEDRKKAGELSVRFMVKGFDGPIDILKTVRDILIPVEIQYSSKIEPEDDDRPAAIML